MYTYTDLDEALRAVDTATAETIRDNPRFEDEEDSVYWDMCQSVQMECSPEVARELARVTGVDAV